jgi:hypothetical protein
MPAASRPRGGADDLEVALGRGEGGPPRAGVAERPGADQAGRPKEYRTSRQHDFSSGC